MAFIGALWQDGRYALRQLGRAPAFAITAIVTLALGIGANTGVFSIIHGVFRPLPVPAADRLVVLAADVPTDDTGLRYQFSYPALNDYREQSGAFSDLFAFESLMGGLSTANRSLRFVYQAVSGNFFAGLRLAPAAGRLFQAREAELPGGEPIVVLGHQFWVTQFGGDPGIVDTFVRIDGQPVRVIGIAPEGFRGLYNGITMDGYMPLGSVRPRGRPADWYVTDRASAFLTIVGRLGPGVTLAAAQASVDVVADRLQRAYPVTEKGVRVRVIPEPEARPIPLRFFGTILPVVRGLLYLLSTMVLLLACLNVTNLLFVRGTTRAREMAVRTALGSGRGRLVRLLMVESTLVAIAGTAAGVAIGQTAGELLARSIDPALDVPVSLEFRYDWPVFRHALLTALGTAMAIGLVPAFRASRTHVTATLHDGGQNATPARRQHLRGALVVMQVAGSLVLLMVAGFLVRSLQRADRIDLGFDPANVLTVSLNPGVLGYDFDRIETFYGDVERRVRAIPGVEAAAISFNTPMSYLIGACPVEPEGAPVVDDRSWTAVAYNSVGSDYFTTMRLPIVRGRAFDDRELSSSTAVIIVNETLASMLWPGADPIGKRLIVRCMTPARPWEVIGVARDSKYIAVFERQQPYLYVSTAQTRPAMRVLQVRSSLPPGELGRRIRRDVAAIDADVSLGDFRTMHGVIAGSLGNVLFRVGATQGTAMGIIGLGLAIVGLYGVASYAATQRTREIGIRLALGADARDVRRLVLRQGVMLAIAGIALGLALSVVVTSNLTRFVVLVSTTDPAATGGVTLMLGAIALVACYLPARRAMRIDAISALRHE